MEITSEQVRGLREKTSVSVMECKKALQEAEGDMAKALQILSARAVILVEKKADRSLHAGVVAAYIHGAGGLGALVQLMCETDFVSKNDEFVALARDIAMHITAMRPRDKDELMAQVFIKDGKNTIADLISGATQKFGERVEVSQMSVFSVK